MKLPILLFSVSFLYSRVSFAEDAGDDNSSCPWDFGKYSDCGDFNNFLAPAGDCAINAQTKGLKSCRDNAKIECRKGETSDGTDFKDIKGCLRSCVRFHKKCCCPAKTNSPTAAPTISSEPTSLAPTSSPTITCPWSDFKRTSSCKSYDTDEVGGDCKFNAKEKLASSCAVRAKTQCDRFEYGQVKGCKAKCRMFHERCCCPVGSALDKPIIAKKPIFDGGGIKDSSDSSD